MSSNTTAPTQFLQASNETYAYHRFGSGSGLPLLFLQHFTGTLDNWDPAVTDALASGREVLLFESAGIGRSTGKVPDTIAGMAKHAFDFLDGLGLKTCDVLGFSLGGMVAQQMAQDRPSIFRRMILVGTAPRGGEDIMHVDKPSLAKYLGDPKLQGYEVLQKIFFAPTELSQTAGTAFIDRLAQRREDREPASGPQVAQAQLAAFRDWEKFTGQRFANLKSISHPTLVVNGIFGDDSGPELLLAECESAQRGPSDLSRLRPRLVVSISRVLHAPSGGILSFRLKVRALLSSAHHFGGLASNS